MRTTYLLLLCLFCFACSRDNSSPPATSGIETNHFAILETELSPAILIHSESKYLGLLADSATHIAFSTRNGPRPFRRGEILKADELEESWLLLWGQTLPPWVLYLQYKPLALSLNTNGLHLSFGSRAGDVVLLPLHGSSTNVDTRKWSEFLKREPLLRIRYWAGALREFPFECHTTLTPSNTVHQRFRYHSIRDHWNTRPFQLAPVPPPLALIADEQLKRKLRELEMPTPFGPYVAFEGVAEWTASFPALKGGTNCAWAALGDCKLPAPNTALVHPIQNNPTPRISSLGIVTPARDELQSRPTETRLNPSSRLTSY